ncbi:MAG: hypothetical protein ACM3UN_02015 [Bacillota bacterium]
MDRNQAVSVIKQIFDQCGFIEGKSIKLMPPKANNDLSNTFQIHIQVGENKIDDGCVKSIADRHNLLVKQKNGLLVVYKPYPDLSDPI